jgi:uncharacterized OsmC-like protein
MTITQNPIDNGVNVEALLGAREAMTSMPAAAAFTFRADCQWINGTHSRTTVQKFFGIGEEQSHRQAFVLDTDHPELFAAEDHGVTPPEMALVALVGCLTGGIASVAQHRGIQLRSVTATVEGDMDLQGMLGIDPDVRNGYSDVRVRYDIDANATHEEIEAVVAQSQKRSVVFDLLTNPTNVAVEVA